MERRRQLMARLIASFREPIQPETIAVYLDELRPYTDDELDHAITYWVREKPKFPAISELLQACKEKRTADKTWTAPQNLLEGPTEPPIQKSFVSTASMSKADRMKQLNRYPALLNRYKGQN